VVHRKRLDGDAVVVVNDARLDLERIDVMTCPIGRLEPVKPLPDVLPIRCQNVIRHALQPRGTVSPERILSPRDPRTEDQVRVASGVIRVEVRQKGDSEPRDIESLDSRRAGRSGSPDDARTEVDEVRRPVDHDSDRRTGARRIGVRRPRPQQDGLRSRTRMA